MSDTLPDVPDRDEPEPAEAVVPPTPVDSGSPSEGSAVEDAPTARRRDAPGDTSS